MKYNKLGTSGLEISEVSFGCMSLKGTHAENAKLLHSALDHGINYFDTADLYDRGENEISVGRAFKDMRNKVVIATKVGNQWRADGSGWDWNPRKDYILQAVDQSLKRLQTDYLDLYQLHGGTLDDPIDDTIEAFELLKEQGKIRAYGISSIRPNVIREYVKRSKIVSVMMQYSLLDRRPEEEAFSLLEENDISVLIRGAYAQGLLTGKPAKPYLNYTADEVTKAAKTISNLANDTRSAAEISGRFVLAHPAISSAVLGIRTEEQLQDAIKLANSKSLTNEELEELRSVLKVNIYEQHR